MPFLVSDNQRWSLDFVSDTLACGRRIRVLVDDFTRENLALVPDTSLSGARVARALDAIIAVRGTPLMIVSDNGTELTTLAMQRWTQGRLVDWHYTTSPDGHHTNLGRQLRMVELRGTSIAAIKLPKRRMRDGLAWRR